MIKALIVVIYLAIGIVVAANNGYFGNLGAIMGILSAVIAVILWPLVLFGVNLHLGETTKDGNGKSLGLAVLALPYLRARLGSRH